MALHLATSSRLVRQCAWCWLVADSSGAYARRATRKLRWATHGICPACKEVVRAEIEAAERPRRQPRPALAA